MGYQGFYRKLEERQMRYFSYLIIGAILVLSSLASCNAQSATTLVNSQGEVIVRLESADSRIVNGQGADTDIIVASVKAYLDALNLIAAGGIKPHPQLDGV